MIKIRELLPEVTLVVDAKIPYSLVFSHDAVIVPRISVGFDVDKTSLYDCTYYIERLQ